MLQKEFWDKLITYRNLRKKDRVLTNMNSLRGKGRERLADEQDKIKTLLSKKNDEDEKKTIIPKSMNVYLSRLNSIYHDVFGTPLTSSNLDNIVQHEKILKEVYPKSDKDYNLQQYTSVLNDLAALIGIGVRYSDSKDMNEALDKYRSVMKEVKTKREKLLGENNKTKHEKAVWDDLEDLKAKVRKIDPLDSLSAMVDKALLSLYTELPPRRLEYKDLVIKRLRTAGKGPPTKDDKNYIEVSPQNIVKRIILNKYKTSKIYGQFVFVNKDINRYLINGLKPLLDKREDGDYLFQNRRDNSKLIDTSNFSAMIKDAFMRRIGKPIKVNDLRHMYASKLWEKNPTNNELKENAARMGHSVETSLQYRRIGNDE
jgi:hypothetical protein